jgi:hypothetical protein
MLAHTHKTLEVIRGGDQHTLTSSRQILDGTDIEKVLERPLQPVSSLG